MKINNSPNWWEGGDKIGKDFLPSVRKWAGRSESEGIYKIHRSIRAGTHSFHSYAALQTCALSPLYDQIYLWPSYPSRSSALELKMSIKLTVSVFIVVQGTIAWEFFVSLLERWKLLHLPYLLQLFDRVVNAWNDDCLPEQLSPLYLLFLKHCKMVKS